MLPEEHILARCRVYFEGSWNLTIRSCWAVVCFKMIKRFRHYTICLHNLQLIIECSSEIDDRWPSFAGSINDVRGFILEWQFEQSIHGLKLSQKNLTKYFSKWIYQADGIVAAAALITFLKNWYQLFIAPVLWIINSFSGFNIFEDFSRDVIFACNFFLLKFKKIYFRYLITATIFLGIGLVCYS